MQRLRILVILILLSLMPLYSLAVLNEGQYAFRSLDINNGLSQNTVHAILQDKQGFMWFGTKDGLDRYDGISFRTFMKESGTLGNNFITSLYEDNLGQIWIGTDVGLYVYCPQMEKVRHFTLISNPNIDIDCTVNLITGDQKGGIWVVTQTRGIFYYNPQDSQLVNYQSDGSGTLNLKTSGQLYFDSDDVCWLDIRDGNLYYSKDKLKTLTPIFPEDSKVSFRDEYIYKLLPGPYNCMYVGTVFGLKEVNLTNKTIRTLLSKDELGGDIYIRELAFYSDDELWIGTESGLYIYNLHTAKIIHLQNVNGDPYSISDNAIYSILKDREGGMWIGTYFGGVNYYPRQYTYFDKVYPQKESNKMGKRVREFCAAHDGTLWIGTEDKGLFHYYPSTGKIEPFIHPDIYHNVHGLYLDGDYLWVGNFAKGLKRIDLRTYAVKHYDNIASDIFSICRITAGDLYLGTTIGLFRYNPDTERFKRVPELGWTFVYYIRTRVLERNEMEAWQKLIRVLTHEIMNSITPIISLSETLSEREVSEKNYPVMRQGMQTIYRRSKGLLEFVENYRKLTRLPAPVRRPVAVRELLQDLQKLFSEEYIRIELPETDRILQIDRTQIEQVLINLIKNAKEACSRKEHPRIEVKMLPALSWQCLITVSDNGEGILPEVQDKIFVPFFTTKPSGSGIGLSLCKQVMNRHGGNITVQSAVGKGSCFTLLFG